MPSSHALAHGVWGHRIGLGPADTGGAQSCLLLSPPLDRLTRCNVSRADREAAWLYVYGGSVGGKPFKMDDAV